MSLKIATWNINSVRLRLDLIANFTKQHQPDLLCLQEIKCANDHFPEKKLRAMGYEHFAVHGQKAYHGVAILSKHPLKLLECEDFDKTGDTRHQAVVIQAGNSKIPKDLTLHNFYIPAGGDEPNPETNIKFANKLRFLQNLEAHYQALPATKRAHQIMVGDLNIAPGKFDVWSHKALLKIVSHTPIEVEHLAKVQKTLDWVDLMRDMAQDDEKLYSWWSYRAKDWLASNRGRRLDHIWITPDLKPFAKTCEILTNARGWERPSDHVPVIVDFVF